MENALEKAITAAGGVTRLAELIGQSPQTVSNWKNRSGGIPPVEHCPDIERVTRELGAPVLCEELRPEVDWAVLREPIKAAA
jgi:DNA-binding transcriptional regulator YdaS (Cro superfamily)